MQTLRTQTRRAALTGLALTSLAFAGLTAAPAAHAQTTTVYSNITNFQEAGYAGGGASGTGPTTLVADDITPLAGFAGSEVTTFTFSIANLNSAMATASPTVDIYSANGSGAGPGTLLAAFAFGSVTLAGDSVGLFTATSATGLFALPTGTFWAGVSFSGAPTATLDNFGQGLFSPPTVGSSQDLFFKSSGPDAGGSNPPGGFFNFGGDPPANFGWSFGVPTPPAAVPEASTTVSFGLLLALGLGGVVIARKKASA